MEVREANVDDWNRLLKFFSRIYRANHPLQNQEFWHWQYGDAKFGRSFISLDESGEITGHVGANFGGGIAWIINVYLDESCRGKGILGKLYSLARNYHPLAATAANAAGLGLYRNMRWIRYHDLVRYVKVNPAVKDVAFETVCRPVSVSVDALRNSDSHYFKQPGVKGLKLNGATAVSQENVGGLRIVDIENIKNAEEHAWELGYLWLDYITSWNDLKSRELELGGWQLDDKSVVPWRLNPVQEGYFCDITFLSEKPLDNEFIVHRSYSDHGRVGSLIS